LPFYAGHFKAVKDPYQELLLKINDIFCDTEGLPRSSPEPFHQPAIVSDLASSFSFSSEKARASAPSGQHL
jgi:hypothetical protein